jgi:Zn-dependent M28 family amino/carboxypeptidase
MLSCALATSAKAQEPVPSMAVELAPVSQFQDVVDRVSGDSVLATLRKLESLGVKAAGTQGLIETRDWLEAKYRSFGYSAVTRQGFALRSDTLQNVIVTKQGTLAADTVLIIGGHYDTIRGPGVNDNGSGVAVMLEVARILAGIDTELTITFVNFAAEEIGLFGSRAYVREIVVPQEMNILLMLNIDEVGGVAGAANDMITCERDQRAPAENDAASSAYTDTLAALSRAYTRLETRIDRAYGSDYLPFQSAGYVITGFYETNESRFPHTPNDVLENMDPEYVTQVARATVAAALHFARAERGAALP